MSSENSFPGFRDRLATLIGGDEPFLWARQVGIPSSTFDRVWNNGQVPKAETLFRISRFAGVSIDWLLSGTETHQSEAVPTPEATTPSAIDTGLYGRVLEQVAAVYQECGITASLAQIGANAAEIAGDLSSPDFTTNTDQAAALKYALTQLRRTLQAANHTKPGDAQGKQRA